MKIKDETLPTPFNRVYLAWVAEDPDMPTHNKSVTGEEYVVVLNSSVEVNKEGYNSILEMYWSSNSFIPLTAFEKFTEIVTSFTQREYSKKMHFNGEVFEFIMHDVSSGHKSLPKTTFCPLCGNLMSNDSFVLGLELDGSFIHYNCLEKIKKVNQFLFNEYSDIILKQKLK